MLIFPIVIHFVKYNVIGLLNTAITLVLVWILHQWMDISVVIANLVGYIAGGLNSYLWNRIWNFKSRHAVAPQVVRFAIVFLLSYLLNLGVLLGTEWILANWDAIQPFLHRIAFFCKPGYISHLIANAVYVLVSYSLYKNWVFRKS